LGSDVAILAMALATAAAAPPAPPPATGAKLTVSIAGIRSDRGTISCELFSSPTGFPKDSSKAVQLTKAAIEKRAATCVFGQLTPGTYAVAAYHDENGNGKLDTNFLGIPSEGVGASNDAKGSMGPPSFEKARFAVGTSDLGITIHLSY
jgi:uncharacterized protein (DUF2141 family)